jgi:hypothetical protein
MNNNHFSLNIRTVANGWTIDISIGSYGQPGYRNETYTFNERDAMLAFMQEQLIEAPQSNLGAPGDQW